MKKKARSKGGKKSLDDRRPTAMKRHTGIVLGRGWSISCPSSHLKTASQTTVEKARSEEGDLASTKQHINELKRPETDGVKRIVDRISTQTSKPGAAVTAAPPQFTAINRPHADAHTTKTVSFTDVDEIESDSNDELPSQKELLSSLVTKSVKPIIRTVHAAETPATESVVHKKDPVEDSGVEGIKDSKMEEDMGFSGDVSFTFDDILESVELMA
jgi:hypothetical protein